MSTVASDHPSLHVERRDTIVVVTMDDGRANALRTDLSEALIETVNLAEEDASVAALVLVGRAGRFSAGFDLGVFQSGDLDAVNEMVATGGRLVAKLYGSGLPVVAACTGHAIAAGALLLLGCDRRIGPDADIRIGLNEVAIGLQLPDWALAIAQERLSRRHLQAAVTTARLYDGTGAVDAGFLDVVVPPDDVVEVAVAEAVALGELDRTAYAGTIAVLRGPTLTRMG